MPTTYVRISKAWMYIYPCGARLKIRWSGRKRSRHEILDDRWARNDKGREKTKNDWSIERFESWRKVLGYERVKKGVESWPRLIRRLTKDANSLETDLHRSLWRPPATSTTSSRFCATSRNQVDQVQFHKCIYALSLSLCVNLHRRIAWFHSWKVAHYRSPTCETNDEISLKIFIYKKKPTRRSFETFRFFLRNLLPRRKKREERGHRLTIRREKRGHCREPR